MEKLVANSSKGLKSHLISSRSVTLMRLKRSDLNKVFTQDRSEIRTRHSHTTTEFVFLEAAILEMCTNSLFPKHIVRVLFHSWYFQTVFSIIAFSRPKP